LAEGTPAVPASFVAGFQMPSRARRAAICASANAAGSRRSLPYLLKYGLRPARTSIRL
jgi:hypothetical protein